MGKSTIIAIFNSYVKLPEGTLLYLFFYGKLYGWTATIRHADLQVEIKITAHHKGHFEFSICRLGLRIKVLQGGSCVFVQYLFGCRCTRPECFGMCHPTYFQDVFSGANIRFLTFFRLGMPLYYTLVPETQAAKGPHGPRSEVIRRSRPPWAMHRAVWMNTSFWGPAPRTLPADGV